MNFRHEQCFAKDKRIAIALESGKYTVLPDGRIINHNYNKTGQSKEISQNVGNRGYVQIKLLGVGPCSLSRVMGIAFLGLPEIKTQINHKNGKKTDNRVENIEWVTSQENIKHAHDTGLMHPARGERTRQAILTEDQVKEIAKHLKKGELTVGKIAKIYGVSNSAIDGIRRGANWAHITGICLSDTPERYGRGSKHYLAKLNDRAVRRIRKMLDSGVMQKDVAKEFGVTKTTIQYVASGRTWSHVK